MAKKRPRRPTTPEHNPDEIVLPDGPYSLPEDLHEYTWWIFGEKGIGKSTLAAQFTDIIAHFMFEPGRRLASPVIPNPARKEKPLTWSRFKSYLAQIGDSYDSGRLVIDSIDIAAASCERYICKTLGIESVMGVNDHGRTWSLLKSEWDTAFFPLIDHGIRFTFLSHARNRPKVVRGYARDDLKELIEQGVIPIETQPSCRSWAYDFGKVPTDVACYYGYYGQERVLHVRGSETMYAACGPPGHFLDPETGDPYDVLPMGSSPKQAFSNLQAGWNNELAGYIVNESAYPTE